MGLEVLLVHLARLQLLERLLRLVVLRLMLLDEPAHREGRLLGLQKKGFWQNLNRKIYQNIYIPN